MTRIAVRPVTADDWRALRQVRLAALADAPGAFVTTYAEAAAYSDETWQDHATHRNTVLAWRGEQPVGMAAGFVDDDDVPQLVAMWVAPDARGSGALEALVDGVVAWARDARHDELRLWVVEGNHRAERAYTRYGFTRTGRDQPVPGRPEDVEVEMRYRLRGAQIGMLMNGEL